MNLLQRLRHLLFGTHYLAIEYGMGSIVRPVRCLPNGRRYIKAYGDIFILDDVVACRVGGGGRRRYIPLTWKEGANVP